MTIMIKADFVAQSIRAVLKVSLTCEACGKRIERDVRFSPTELAAQLPGKFISLQVCGAFRDVVVASRGTSSSYGPQNNWSTITDSDGEYVVCPGCHRAPRAKAR